jgi:hypothetical protein
LLHQAIHLTIKMYTRQRYAIPCSIDRRGTHQCFFYGRCHLATECLCLCGWSSGSPWQPGAGRNESFSVKFLYRCRQGRKPGTAER